MKPKIEVDHEISPSSRSTRRLSVYWPALPPLLTAFVGLAIFLVGARSDTHSNPIFWDIGQVAGSETGAQIDLVGTGVFLVVSAVTSLFFSIRAIVRRSTIFDLIVSCVLAAILVLLFELTAHLFGSSLIDDLGLGIFRDTVGKLWTGPDPFACPGYVRPFLLQTASGLCGVGIMQLILEIGGFLLVVSLAFATIAAALVALHGEDYLPDRMSPSRDAVGIIFLMGVVGAAAVAYFKAWTDLPTSFFPVTNPPTVNPVMDGFRLSASGFESFLALLLSLIVVATATPLFLKDT